MNIVDSSAWLEYFAGTKNAAHFEKIIENTSELIVPSIVIYEVYKKILIERDENSALIVAAHLKHGKVVDLDTDLAILAAKISFDYKLPMADSIILATAQKYEATVWTQDSDFEGIDGVKYFWKK